LKERAKLCQKSMRTLLKRMVSESDDAPIYLLTTPFRLQLKSRLSEEDYEEISSQLLVEGDGLMCERGIWNHPEKKLMVLLSGKGELAEWAARAFKQAALRLNLHRIAVESPSHVVPIVEDGRWDLSGLVLDKPQLEELPLHAEVEVMRLCVGDHQVGDLAPWLENFPRLKLLDLSGSSLSSRAHFNLLFSSVPPQCLLRVMNCPCLRMSSPNHSLFKSLSSLDRLVWISEPLWRKKALWTTKIKESRWIDAIDSAHNKYYTLQ